MTQSHPSISLILVDPSEALCAAWRAHLGEDAGVLVVRGRFEQLKAFDCMVSAANSFGLMDGGVDAAITRFFGDALMERVQARILDEFLGEQPVGTCMIVETGHPRHPFVAHAPTMRVPMAVASTDYAYLAMWAVLLAVHRHNRGGGKPIASVACPGLATGCGQFSPDEAARQMALAWRHFVSPPERIDWPYAEFRQQQVRRGGDKELEQRLAAKAGKGWRARSARRA